ncbi:hypothetical protein ACWF94_06725 [Streptomyces sp. NPDC055078]
MEPGRDCDVADAVPEPSGADAVPVEERAAASEGGREGVPGAVSTGGSEDSRGLSLTGDRPGRGRPSPAGRPASDGEALGRAVGVEAAGGVSSAYEGGVADNSRGSVAMAIAHRVRSLGVTG